MAPPSPPDRFPLKSEADKFVSVLLTSLWMAPPNSPALLPVNVLPVTVAVAVPGMKVVKGFSAATSASVGTSEEMEPTLTPRSPNRVERKSAKLTSCYFKLSNGKLARDAHPVNRIFANPSFTTQITHLKTTRRDYHHFRAISTVAEGVTGVVEHPNGDLWVWF